jgi:hypothetical protein
MVIRNCPYHLDGESRKDITTTRAAREGIFVDLRFLAFFG